jgi:hypothetical protein
MLLHIPQDYPCKLNNFFNAYWPSYILNRNSAVYKIYPSFPMNLLPTFSVHELVKLYCVAFSLPLLYLQCMPVKTEDKHKSYS